MIGEIPASYFGGALPREEAGATVSGGPALPAIRDIQDLELRLTAGFGGGNEWGSYGGLGGWGSGSGWGRCPPHLVMSTAALRCRVVILDNLAKARPVIRDIDTKKEYTGEFADRIAHPMGDADPGMSLRRWVTVCVSSMLEQGDAHVWKSEEKYLTRFARSGKALRRAYIPLPVGCVDPTPGKAFWKVGEWVYTDPVTGLVVTIPPEEMARIEYLWNPKDYHRGVGPMEACKLAIETDYWYALQARNRQMKGGLPALLLMNQRAGTQDQELKAFLAEFRRQMVDERGGVAGLGSDWKVERLSMTAQEADEINARRYMVEEIARAHGIPLIDLAVYTSTGFGREGMDILNRMRHTATIQPLSERFADGVTQQIVAEVEPGLEFAFDWTEVRAAQDDMGEMIGYAERLFALGVPMDEAARITNLALEDYTGKTLGFLQGTLLTMEEIMLRLETAKNPPEPPPMVPGMPPEMGGPPPDGGTPPDVQTQDETDQNAEKNLADEKQTDEAKQARKKKSEGVPKEEASRAERMRAALRGARIVAAAVLPADELDRLEARARKAGMSVRAFDRLIAQATPREVEGSIKFQKKVDPHAKKIQKVYESGVNKQFKELNKRLWAVQKTREKIRIPEGTPPPPGVLVYSDNYGDYYFGALDSLEIDKLIAGFEFEPIAEDIIDVESDAFDTGVDSMNDELNELGYLGAALLSTSEESYLLRRLEEARKLYLDQRSPTVKKAFDKIRDRVYAMLNDSFLAGEDIGTISKRLMKDEKPNATGGDRQKMEDADLAGARGEEGGASTEPEVVDKWTTEGRGPIWGDEEAYNAANSGRAALAGEQSRAIQAANAGAVPGEPTGPGELPLGGRPAPAVTVIPPGFARPPEELPPELWWRWITMEDERVRAAHEDIHGVAVPIGDEFIDGTGLTYPGDPAADLDLTINCRCWTTVLGPEEVALELDAA